MSLFSLLDCPVFHHHALLRRKPRPHVLTWPCSWLPVGFPDTLGSGASRGEVWPSWGCRKPPSEHTALEHPPHSYSSGTSAKSPAPGHTVATWQGPGVLLRPSCFHPEPRWLDPPLHVWPPMASLQRGPLSCHPPWRALLLPSS